MLRWKRPKLSDEQFVARVRRWHRKRKWLGIEMIVTGLLMMGFAWWMYSMLTSTPSHFDEAVFDHVSDVMDMAMSRTSFLLGVILGFVSYGSGFGGFLLLWLGLSLWIGDRRDQLLLQYWDRLHPHGDVTGDATRNENR